MSTSLAERIRSRRLAVALLIAVAVLAVSGTIFTAERAGAALRSLPGLLVAARFLGLAETNRSPVFLLLVALIGLNMAACTWHRSAPLWGKAGAAPGGRRRLRLAFDAAMHLSLLAILAGGVGKGFWGSVRTMNVHVGGATDSFYDFTSATDVPLGFTVEVLERQESWYPARAMIGVSDSAAGTKIALVEAVEGRTVAVPGVDLSLRLATAGPAGGPLRLEASGGGRTGTLEMETAEGEKASADFGQLRVTLVAWRRDLKGVRSRIACVGAGFARQEGWISPRERLACRGVGLALTAWGTDTDGKPYVGIQAVRDPTAPLFWWGCVALVIFMALFLALRRREPHREMGVPEGPARWQAEGMPR